MKASTLTPQFVEKLPRNLSEGVLYISKRYSIASHLCCCGCKQEVVTPLSPARWTLHVHGDKVTLTPSIGNWNYACKSHYWIKQNSIVWARTFTAQEIARVKQQDRSDLVNHLTGSNRNGNDTVNMHQEIATTEFVKARKSDKGIFDWICTLIGK